MMEHKFTEKEMKGFWSFLVETFTLSEDETAAVCHQIPMTQDIYDSILDKCDEIGPDLDRLFYCMLKEYPEYTAVRAERIEERIKDVELPPMSEEEREIEWQKLLARIRAEYGADAR